MMMELIYNFADSLAERIGVSLEGSKLVLVMPLRRFALLVATSFLLDVILGLVLGYAVFGGLR